MSDRILSLEEARYARTLLEQERDSLLPSKFQLIVYRVFNAVAFCFLITAVIGGAGLVASEVFGWDEGALVGCFALIVIGALSVLLIPIFLLNLPLVLKFRRLAEFRRDLGLTVALTSIFKHERGKAKVRNLLTGLGVLIGLSLVGYSLFSLVEKHWRKEHSTLDVDDLVFPAVVIILGLSLLALHYMRRAKERLAVVSRLLDSFIEETADSEEAARDAISMPAASYESVARLERERILLERKESIVAASKKTDISSFALQRSNEVHAALDDLGHEGRASAEEAIYALMHDSSPAASSEDAATGLRVLPIESTGMELLYEVDKELQRVRLHRLRPAAGSSPAPEPGKDDGGSSP